MLTYLDRSPPELENRARLALMTIRLWATEMRRDRCPIGVLRHALPRWNAQGALWPAHNFLSWLLAYAARGIELGCPCCGRVSDDEALMLAALFAGDRTQAQAALATLVGSDALDGAVRRARMLGAEFNAVEPIAPR